MGGVPNDSCAIARALGVLGERWTFLVLREATTGATKFSEFRKSLGISPDILADRLSTLVEHGVMEKVAYREPGARARASYRLSPAGHELIVLLAALQQWGDNHLPWPDGPTVLRRVEGTDRPVHVGFIDSQGCEVDRRKVAMVPSAAGTADTNA